jgi:hypothetical protein
LFSHLFVTHVFTQNALLFIHFSFLYKGAS